jgi:hypothetical protein
MTMKRYDASGVEDPEGIFVKYETAHQNIQRLVRNIKSLQDGDCRFNCRNKRKADFAGGFTAASMDPQQDPDKAFEEYVGK